MTPWSGPIIVTGTDTGVGKTVATAGIAAAARSKGAKVAVLKAAQTGDDDDAAEVARLSGLTDVRVGARYPAPLAPLAAANLAGYQPLEITDVIEAAQHLASNNDVVLIEGAGGLLVPMGANGWTVADLAAQLHAHVIVVARAGLGTLNHTALTCEALRARALPHAVVIGAWPRSPELAHHSNLNDLPPLDGLIPAAAAKLPPFAFQNEAPGWFTARLYGTREAITSESGIRNDRLSG